MAKRFHVVVDGSNLATEGRSQPRLAQLDEAVRTFGEEHPDADIVVVVDANFAHRIPSSERAELEQALLHGELVSPPAGTVGRGDAFVLRIAQRIGAVVLSNDSFQEFQQENPWLFDGGRLIGGKPVPGVGWIFAERLPVRPSRRAKGLGPAETKLQPATGTGKRARIGDSAPTSTGLAAKIGKKQAKKAPAKKTAKQAVTPPAKKTAIATNTKRAATTPPTKRSTPTAQTKAPADPLPTKAPAKSGATGPAPTKAPAKSGAAKSAAPTKAPAKSGATGRKKAPATTNRAPAKRAAKQAVTPPAKKPAGPTTKRATTPPTKRSTPARPTRSTAKSAAPTKAPAKSGATGRKKAPATTKKTAAKRAPGKRAAKQASTPPAKSSRKRRGAPPPTVNDPAPFIAFVAQHALGSNVEGQVASFTSHGAMIDVPTSDGAMLHCYVPLARLADPPPRKAREVLRRGEQREFVLVGLDPGRRAAELGLPGLAQAN